MTVAPGEADADCAFDKAVTNIKLLGATPGAEPSSSKEQVELFYLKGHKLALEDGRQMVEQLRRDQGAQQRRAQSPAPRRLSAANKISFNSVFPYQ